MNIAVNEIGPDAYEEYAQLSPGFQVKSVLECEPVRDGLGGLALSEAEVASPYPKYWPPDDCPTNWARKHDLAKWGIFIATTNGQVAGARPWLLPPRESWQPNGTTTRPDFSTSASLRISGDVG